MWKAAVVAVCVLLAGVGAMDGPTYGVKLCGREFIRAVIFTCGGSRWRRSISSTDELSLDSSSWEDGDGADRWSLTALLQSPLQKLDQASSFSSSSFSSSMGRVQAGQQQQEVQQDDGAAFTRPARSVISEEILEALRTSSRKGRDVVVGLSNACCKWGCSKSEISSLC